MAEFNDMEIDLDEADQRMISLFDAAVKCEKSLDLFLTQNLNSSPVPLEDRVDAFVKSSAMYEQLITDLSLNATETDTSVVENDAVDVLLFATKSKYEVLQHHGEILEKKLAFSIHILEESQARYDSNNVVEEKVDIDTSSSSSQSQSPSPAPSPSPSPVPVDTRRLRVQALYALALLRSTLRSRGNAEDVALATLAIAQNLHVDVLLEEADMAVKACTDYLKSLEVGVNETSTLCADDLNLAETKARTALELLSTRTFFDQNDAFLYHNVVYTLMLL